jgi:hypothetical protein
VDDVLKTSLYGTAVPGEFHFCPHINGLSGYIGSNSFERRNCITRSFIQKVCRPTHMRMYHYAHAYVSLRTFVCITKCMRMYHCAHAYLSLRTCVCIICTCVCMTTYMCMYHRVHAYVSLRTCVCSTAHMRTYHYAHAYVSLKSVNFEILFNVLNELKGSGYAHLYLV